MGLGRIALRLDNDEYKAFVFACPGCGSDHIIYTKHPKGGRVEWSWDGSYDKPTFSPSLKLSHKGDAVNNVPPYCCHSFIRGGRIQYLNDCTHSLAGQTVDLPEIERCYRGTS